MSTDLTEPSTEPNPQARDPRGLARHHPWRHVPGACHVPNAYSCLWPDDGGDRRDAGYAAELPHSVDAFLDHDSHCDRAAGQVFRHRHTLRCRIRRIEQLTGRGLCRQRDRIEPWLDLRGRELAP